jgi:hypothetical protein
VIFPHLLNVESPGELLGGPAARALSQPTTLHEWNDVAPVEQRAEEERADEKGLVY